MTSTNDWPTAVGAPALRPGEVHVWRVDLSGDPTSLTAFLDVAERGRADRFAHDALRDRWIVSRAGLRAILGACLGQPPRSVQFETTPMGKPGLSGSVDRSIEFSISHSDRLALIAVASGSPVGVDVERIRELTDIDHLIERYFCASERAELEPLEGRELTLAFHRCWTRKEAVLKAAGLGLHAPLQEICVETRESARPKLRSLGESANASKPLPPPDRWTMVSLDADPDFIAVVAVPAPVSSVRCWTWEPERAT